jgi:internalin A
MGGIGEVPARFQAFVEDDGRQVSLASQDLTAVPDWLRGLTGVTTLDLAGNQLSELPEWLGSLSALTALDLSGNALSALPGSIGNLSRLENINLSGNSLRELPESFARLASLESLDLGGNKLIKLPARIGELGSLRWLSLYGNDLTGLPESIGNLGQLRTLDLLATGLMELPESVGNLRRLSDLILRDNNLTTLPESISALPQLHRLDLRNNKLTRVPRQWAELLRRETEIQLNGNPLRDPFEEIIRHGHSALLAYLESLEDAVSQYEAKLLMVGEGNVGKTSLVAALRGAPFAEDRPTTHGIEVWPLTFRHPRVEHNMTLHTWDFGGQEVYRVSHQFFFSRHALYLVVWKARDGHEQDEVEEWLRRIRLRTDGKVRAVIVATHCAERAPDLDYPHLEQLFPGMLVGNFEVDNSIGIGIETLRKAIASHAAELPTMGQEISSRWTAARDDILARASSDPQISFGEFAAACARHGIPGQQAVTLAQFMHHLGQIVHYAEDEGLKDVVVLNPEWLTKAISYVLEDQATRDSAGVLDHARLKEIWQNKTDGPSYPAQYHRYFLRLMEKFDISYRIEDDELHSIVAQLVPHERPKLPWALRSQPPVGTRVLSLVCRLSEPAFGLIPWLTVRHHHASTGKHWRRGIFLRHPIATYASEALIELHSSTELLVEVHAPTPELFFNVLRYSIEDLITHRWPGLKYQLLIPCPGEFPQGTPCTGLFPLAGVMKRRELGKSHFSCQECAEDYEVSLLLTGFAIPDQPLKAELTQVQKQLARIEDGVTRTEQYAATSAESLRRVLRVVSTEVTDCPGLFTLVPDQAGMVRRLKIFQKHYRLTLWCEHPGYWHPWSAAAYDLDPPREWFAKVSPYAALIFATLQLAVPIAGSVAANVLIPVDQFDHAKGELELMKILVANFPEQGVQERGHSYSEALKAGQLTAAEGQGLRALRTLLFEQDQPRSFGGLRRVQAPTGDFLWVCPDHYPSYDPGLPVVP